MWMQEQKLEYIQFHNEKEYDQKMQGYLHTEWEQKKNNILS